MPTIIQAPSPSRSGKLTPRYIMLHHTASTNFAATVKYLRRLTTPASAHFVVGKDGEIAQLVPLTAKAWHAGKGGPYKTIPRNGGNQYCVGIEIVNKGDGKDPFPAKQLKALDWLINHIDVALGHEYPIIDHKAYTSRKIDMRHNFPLGNYQAYRRHEAPKRPTVAATVIGPKGGVTMRSTASTKSPVLRKVDVGGRVIVKSQSASWSEITYGGKTGFVPSRYLDLD